MTGPSTHQDSPIERFNAGDDPEHPGFSEMHPADEGHWVRYTDYEKLKEEWADEKDAREHNQRERHKAEKALEAEEESCRTLTNELALAKARRADA